MPKVVNVHKRVDEYANEGFYVFDLMKRTVMCKYCNSRIDWSRKDSCEKHIATAQHKQKKDLQQAGPSTRQISLHDSLQNAKKIKLDKEEFNFEVTKAFIDANIPLEKLENSSLRGFLNKYCPGSGDLCHADTLRTKYLHAVGEKRIENLKEAVKDKPVCILCDETTDKAGKCVFIVLIKPLNCSAKQRLYVGGVRVLENANGAECARAILTVVTESKIEFRNVIAIATDSARYMTTCVESLKIPFNESMVHIQCWAHKLNLVACLWSTQLHEVNACVTYCKLLFLNTRKRKHRYLSYLKTKYPNGEKSAILFPMPVMTRWTSWDKSAEYMKQYCVDVKGFCMTLDEESQSVIYFKNLTDEDITVIQVMATFLAEHCKPIIEMIVTLEGNSYPYAHKVYEHLQDHLRNFENVANGIIGELTLEQLTKIKVTAKKCQLREKIKTVAMQCHSKLCQLINEDKGKLFIKSISKLFDTRNIVSNKTDSTLGAIAAKLPLLERLPLKELCEGYGAFQAQVKKLLDEDHQNIDVLWVLLGLQESHPKFIESCVQALWIPVSNVDSERAFSQYGNIFTDLRTSLKPANMEIMLGSWFEEQQR